MPEVDDVSFLPVPVIAVDVDRIVYSGDCVAVGAFRCRPDHPLFEDSGPIRNHCFVFPRTAVEIQHANGAPFLGDPTVITLYNPGQRYRRRATSPEGDYCDYYVVSPPVMHEMLQHYDPEALDEVGGFRTAVTSSTAALYLQQRQFFRALTVSAAPDPLVVEEFVLTMLGDLLSTGSETNAAGEKPTVRKQMTMIEDARRLLATNAHEPLRLAIIADKLACSPFHLCRLFRKVTGLTLHQYREQIRLRRALSFIESGMDLTSVALEAGYSSHSHFTFAFRRTFGTTPKMVRRSFRSGVVAVEHSRPGLPRVTD